MASVVLSVGPVTVQVEDEDDTAKALVKLARKELVFIASNLEVTDDEEAEKDG